MFSAWAGLSCLHAQDEAAQVEPDPQEAAAAETTPAPEADEKPASEVKDQPAADATPDGEAVAVASPVPADPVQVFGWREMVRIDGVKKKLLAKLDTGALTSSIHAEDVQLFERDGKKWVRFNVMDHNLKKPEKFRIEAPLVRTALIKEPGGESISREVVKLSFKIGDRKFRGEFTLYNRSNMLAPVLIGRTMLQELGWVDPSRKFIADEKIMR